MKLAQMLLAAVAVIFLTATLAPAGDAMDLLKQKLKEELQKKIDEELGTDKPKDEPEKKPDPQQQQKQAPAPGQLILAEPKMPTDVEARQRLRFDPQAYPRVDGSTSAHPLGVMAATTVTAKGWLWAVDDGGNRRLIPVQYRRVVGPAQRAGLIRPRSKPIEPVATAPPIRAFKEGYVLKDLMQRSWHNGTNQGYVALIQGKADLIIECRLPSADERKLMAETKVDLVATPIARDAFVFLLNQKNPLPGVTAQQVRDIYAGKITQWEQVGRHTGRINAYVRNRNSGSQETMQTLVMRDTKITAGRSMISYTMMGPYNQLPRDANGIGFTFLYYHAYMSPIPGTKVAAIDGVFPTRRTIADGTYPFATDVYLVHRKTLDPASAAGQLARWFLSDAGQAAIARSGYVPIRPVVTGNR